MIDVVWFKRDLRIIDNAALAAAAAGGRRVLPLYIIEPELWRLPQMSGRHYAFLGECLDDLDAALRRLGSRLVIRVGEAVPVFEEIHRAAGIAAIHAHEETGLLWTYDRDRAVRRWARGAGIAFLEARQHGVFRGGISRNGWADRWEAMMRAGPARAPKRLEAVALPSEERPDAAALGLADDPCPERQKGGRAEGLALLGSFLEARGRHYRREMSSPLTGAQSCSRLSAHLAFGCLSMRETYQAGATALARRRIEGDEAFSGSIRAFLSRLHWHCHFIQKQEDAPDLERRALHPGMEGAREIGPDSARLAEAWIEGRTGFPFLDACMRSLAATGWLNFRMRSMAMAFSSYHLWQDWREPAGLLARRFVDFEPGIHYAQAQMQSGATGVNALRIYNPVKQSRDQDPTGAFIRRWVPELSALPDDFLHEPWRAPESLLADRGIVLGRTYPERLVDHEAAAAEARRRMTSLRRAEGFREASRAVLVQHGSRKRGGRMRRRPAPRPSAQGEFDFG